MTPSRYRPPPHPARPGLGAGAEAGAEIDGGDSLERMRNLGPRSAAWLREAGIADADDLRRIGAASAYLRVKQARPREVTRTFLWALAGALLDCPYTRLPTQIKEGLVAQVRGLPTPAGIDAGWADIGTVIAGQQSAGDAGNRETAGP